MDQSLPLLVAGIMFGIVAFFHLLRLVFKFDLSLAGKTIPLWTHVIGLIIAASLSTWMLLAS